MTAKRLLFVCIENSNRSQMAEAFARIYGGEGVKAFSAGSDPSGEVNPKAILAMKEVGYDLSLHHSKSLDDIPAGEFAAAENSPLRNFTRCETPSPRRSKIF